MNLDEEIKIIEKKLEKLKLEKENQELVKFVKPLDEFTLNEKSLFFDECYSFSMKIMQEKIDGIFNDDNDNNQWAYEIIMTIIARDKNTFWNYYNDY